MKQMNPREKNLALLVLFVGLIVGWGRVRKMFDKQVEELRSQLSRSQDQLNSSKALIAKATAPIAAPVVQSNATGAGSRVTMSILKDVTTAREARAVRIVRLDRSGDGSFRLVAEGRFAEMMRFIGMLERMEGRFTVQGGDLSRVAAEVKPTATPTMTATSEPAEPKREIRASLTLNMKGGGV